MNISSALQNSSQTQSVGSGVAPSRANIAREGVNQAVSESSAIPIAADASLVGFTVTNPNTQTQVETAEKRNTSPGQPSEHTPRLDIDEEAIAAVEQLGIATQASGFEGLNTQSNSTQSNIVSQSSANSDGSGNSNSVFDQPSEQNKTAVSAYQSVGSQEKRESVQQVFGVDLFA